MKLIDLSEKKGIRRSKRIHDDILNILNVFTNTKNRLKDQKHYRAVQNILSLIEDEAQVLQIHLNKHRRVIEENED